MDGAWKTISRLIYGCLQGVCESTLTSTKVNQRKKWEKKEFDPIYPTSTYCHRVPSGLAGEVYLVLYQQNYVI